MTISFVLVSIMPSCSRHGFLYIRGWMQMVLAPNDLFSWNNKYNVTNTFTHFLLELCTWTHSVHARILKPWRGSLPWLPAISSSCHVFPLPLTGLNWRSLFPPGGSGPPPSKMAPLFTGSAHTPLPGSGTPLCQHEQGEHLWPFYYVAFLVNIVWPLCNIPWRDNRHPFCQALCW